MVGAVRRRFRPAAAATALALLAAAPAVGQEPSPARWLKVANGVTQRVFPLSRAVEQNVFVAPRSTPIAMATTTASAFVSAARPASASR
jgi:hypothetical protein